MGQVYNLSCKCGYNKDVQIGEGMMGMRLEAIREVFTPEELSEFENALADGLTDYCLGRMLAYCMDCMDIVNANVLRYAVGGLIKIIVKPCEKCKGTLFPYYSIFSLSCPRCSNALSIAEAGLWD